MHSNRTYSRRTIQKSNVQRQSLRRFLKYAVRYSVLLGVAIFSGIVRYLIPLALPWTLKVLVDGFLSPGSTKPVMRLNFFMLGLSGLYVIYAVSSYTRSYFSGLAGHRVIFDLREDLYLHLQRM